MLLCHRHPDRTNYPDVWDLPGGHVEEGESVARTLVRELAEELGIRVPSPGAPNEVVRAGEIEMHVFVVDRWEGEPRNAAEHEHDEIRWVTPDELAGLPLAHETYPGLLRHMMDA